MDANVRECVERGVALLDRVIPDWYEAVQPYSLEMYDLNNCVIGQLINKNRFHSGRGWYLRSYTYACRALGINYAEGESDTDYGFDMGDYRSFGDNRVEALKYLTTLWVDAIAMKRCGITRKGYGI